MVQDIFKSSIPFEPVADSTATITLVKNDNDIVTYTFNGASNQFAVFSAVYYKRGWKAYIDGKEVAIKRADYAFRAIVVPGGTHAVSFVYQPTSFMLGLAGSGIGVLGLLGLVFSGFRRKKR